MVKVNHYTVLSWIQYSDKGKPLYCTKLPLYISSPLSDCNNTCGCEFRTMVCISMRNFNIII